MITFVPDYQKRVKRGLQTWWIRMNGEQCCSPAYLHGKLEREAGFDIIYHTRTFIGPPGIYMPESGHEMVRIHMDSGRFNAVMIYWWSVHHTYLPRFRALICDPHDLDAVRYARSKQMTRDFLL